MSASPKEHPVISVTIEKLVDGGAGLGRWNGRAVFVAGVCAGEDIRARIRSVKKGYAVADLQSVLKPSSDRVRPPCPVFGRCGGCQWQHLDYPAQLRAKVDLLREDLRRIGGISDPSVLAPLPSARPFEYRTRIQLKTDLTSDEPRVGFFAGQSHRIVPVAACPIADPPLDRAPGIIRSALTDPETRLPSLTEVHLHFARGTGEVLIRYFAEAEPKDRIERLFTRVEAVLPNAVGQVYYGRTGDRRVRGRDYIMDRYLGMPFRIADRSFAQVHWDQIPGMVETVRSFASLTGRESVLELYCGIGTFGLFLAEQASELIGVDENEVAIRDAEYNARQQGRSNSRFEAKPVERAVKELVDGQRTFDRVILDPPRAGVGRELLRSLARLDPSKIVYVSCDPATLARDLKILTDLGCRLGRLQPIDLFPQTFHLETVAELDRI